MHYKDGREAHEGDPVICFDYMGRITVGKIHSLIATTDKCNCTVAEPVMGGVQQLTCKTVGEMYHAETAHAAITAIQSVAKNTCPPA